MTEQEILQVFGKVGAVVTNSHIVYTSGKHGTAYVNKDAIYPHTTETSRLCRAIAEEFADDNIEVVIAPAIGGVILSQWTAHHLSEMTKREVLGVYAEKEIREIPSCGHGPPGNVESFVIRRGYDVLVAGKRVLVIEDILTTGDSAKMVTDVTRSIGGNVVGLGALVNRGQVTAEYLQVPRLSTLLNVEFETWTEEECARTGPCSRGVPINTAIGHGKKFLARQKV